METSVKNSHHRLTRYGGDCDRSVIKWVGTTGFLGTAKNLGSIYTMEPRFLGLVQNSLTGNPSVILCRRNIFCDVRNIMYLATRYNTAVSKRGSIQKVTVSLCYKQYRDDV